MDKIKQYFQEQSPKQRAAIRRELAPLIKDPQSILRILELGKQGQTEWAYDAATSILAAFEFDNLELHRQAYLELKKQNNLDEDLLEILITGIGNAYNISAKEKFDLIIEISSVSDRRLVKCAVIDAFVAIAETVTGIIFAANFLKRYTKDSDEYVCKYVQEALDDLNV